MKFKEGCKTMRTNYLHQQLIGELWMMGFDFQLFYVFPKGIFH